MDLEKFLESTSESSEVDYLTEVKVPKIFRRIAKDLSSALKPFRKKIAAYIKKSIRSVKNIKNIFFKRVKTSRGYENFPVYQMNTGEGIEFGYLYPDALLKASGVKSQGGSKTATFMRAHVPSKLEGNAIRIVIDRRFVQNSKASESYVKSINESRKRKGRYIAEAQFDDDDDSDVDMSTKAASKSAFNRRLAAAEKGSDVPMPTAADIMDNQALESYLSTAKINLPMLSDIIREFLYTLNWRKSYDQPVPSLLLLGFPGSGKTSLIRSFEKMGIEMHILEIASLYKEIFGGFPTPEDIYDENGQVKKKISMKAADIFPEEDGKTHIFFFDEFNRDPKKMAVAMNLFLSGSIGTQYNLPLKTIVVASGNLGKEIDFVDVAKLDAATFDRYDAKVMLQKDAAASLAFSGADLTLGGEKGAQRDIPDNLKISQMDIVPAEKVNEYEINLGGMTTSLDIFFNKMVEKYGVELMGKGADKELSLKPLETEYQGMGDIEDEDDTKYMITPRTITKMSDRLRRRVMRDWIESKELGDNLAQLKGEKLKWFPNEKSLERYKDLKKAEDWEKVWEENKEEYLRKGIPSPAALYLHIMQWHKAYLPTILKQFASAQPLRLIKNVLKVNHETRKELLTVSSADIIFGYLYKRVNGHQIEMVDEESGEKISKNLKPKTSDDDLKKQLKDNSTFLGAISSRNTIKDLVFTHLPDFVKEAKTMAGIKKEIESITGAKYADVEKMFSDKGVNLQDPLDVIILNINQFINDFNISTARIKAFIYRLKEFGIIADPNTGETEKEKGNKELTKQASEMVADIYSGLWQLNNKVQETRDIQSGSLKDEIKNESIIEEGLKNLFSRMA